MEVEFPLIKSELEAIDVKLLSAETTLFWNGESTCTTFVCFEGLTYSVLG